MRTFTFCLLILMATHLTATGQLKEASYTLVPLKAKYIDSTDPKQIIIVFKRVTRSGKYEKLIVGGKMTYSLGADPKEKTDIQGQSANQHTISVYGKTMPEKSEFIYNLVKDHPELVLDDNTTYLVFTLRNITDKYIDKMTFTYGLWEPEDQDTRFETKYQLQVDK